LPFISPCAYPDLFGEAQALSESACFF